MKQKIVEKMLIIDSNMTALQKRQMCVDLDLSPMTVNKYLKGEVSKIDVVEAIINYYNLKHATENIL